MNANERESLNNLFEAVVGAAYEVSNTLGAGFLEKVYQRALAKELALRGIPARPQVCYQVSYKGYVIGEYLADLVVDDRLLVELKCVNARQGAPGTMHKLFARIAPFVSTAHQLSAFENGMAPSRL